MQAAFFQLSDIISVETAISSLKKSAVKNYGHQGKAVVDSNLNAIGKVISCLIKIDVPEELGSYDQVAPSRFENVDAPALTEKVIFPIMELKGVKFKASDFLDKHQGFLPRLWEQLNTKREVFPHLFLYGIAQSVSNATDVHLAVLTQQSGLISSINPREANLLIAFHREHLRDTISYISPLFNILDHWPWPKSP